MLHIIYAIKTAAAHMRSCRVAQYILQTSVQFTYTVLTDVVTGVTICLKHVFLTLPKLCLNNQAMIGKLILENP